TMWRRRRGSDRGGRTSGMRGESTRLAGTGARATLRRDDRHARTAVEQAEHPLERHRSAADDEDAAALEVETRHVVLLVRHQTPTEWRRAPCRSSRTVISAAPAASESEKAPG